MQDPGMLGNAVLKPFVFMGTPNNGIFSAVDLFSGSKGVVSSTGMPDNVVAGTGITSGDLCVDSGELIDF